MIDKLGLDGLGGTSIKTTEPAAPDLSGIEPVAVAQVIRVSPGTMSAFVVADGMKEGDLLYSAATVERLVQERDDWQRQSSNNWTSAVKNGLLLAAMTQERDQWKQLAANCELAEEQVSSSYQLAASQAREQQLREVLLYLGKEISEGQGVCIETVVEALFSPQDDTALRQWGAKLLREMVDQVVLGFGDYLRRKVDELENKE